MTTRGRERERKKEGKRERDRDRERESKEKLCKQNYTQQYAKMTLQACKTFGCKVAVFSPEFYV